MGVQGVPMTMAVLVRSPSIDASVWTTAIWPGASNPTVRVTAGLRESSVTVTPLSQVSPVFSTTKQ